MFTVTKGPPVALAVRLWDPVYDRQVDDAFAVSLYLEGAAIKPATAVRSGSGVFYVRQLPGPAGQDPRPVILTVTDLRGRYLPVALRLTLPGEVPPVLRPEGPSLYRVTLDSSPTRGDLPGLAVVRTQLWDETADRPAAHARLFLEVAGGTYSAGADSQGRVCLAFPYPVFRRSLRSDTETPASLYAHTWPMTVRVGFGGTPPAPLAGTGVPDLAALHSQPPALLVPARDQPTDQLTIRLPYGTELVLRSGEQPVLVVRQSEVTT